MNEYLSGGLYVVEKPKASHWVNRALRQLDPDLFLERQLTYDGGMVWCVVCETGGDRPPVTLLEFRDDNGKPIPEPTESLVQRAARMERSAEALNRYVREANERRKQEISRRAIEQTREISLDVMPRISPTRSVLLPRGQYLRRSRDRARARGARV